MNKTKTFTLGETYLKELRIYIKNYVVLLKEDLDKNREQIRHLENFIAFIESAPWNEGGYSIEDFT